MPLRETVTASQRHVLQAVFAVYVCEVIYSFSMDGELLLTCLRLMCGVAMKSMCWPGQLGGGNVTPLARERKIAVFCICIVPTLLCHVPLLLDSSSYHPARDIWLPPSPLPAAEVAVLAAASDRVALSKLESTNLLWFTASVDRGTTGWLLAVDALSFVLLFVMMSTGGEVVSPKRGEPHRHPSPADTGAADSLPKARPPEAQVDRKAGE